MTDAIQKVEGVVFGGEVGEFEFVYNPAQQQPGTRIEIGKLLSIYDYNDKLTYLVRVINIKNGSDRDSSIQEARSVLRFGNQSRPETKEENVYEPRLDNRYYFIAQCEPLMVLDPLGKSWAPTSIPYPLSEVRTVNEEILPPSLLSRFGDLPIGVLRSGRDVFSNIPVGLYKRLLPYHVGVFAKTGKGKSNAVLVLIGVALELRGERSMVIFDPHGEYAQELRRHPLADEYLIQYSKHANRDIKISYEDVSVKTITMVNDALNFSNTQIELLYEAESLYNDWLYKLLHMPIDHVELNRMRDEEAKRGRQRNKSIREKAKDAGFPDALPEFGMLDDDYADPLKFSVQPETEFDDLDGETLKDLFPDFHEATFRSVRRRLRRLVNVNYMVEQTEKSSIPHILTQVRNGKSILIDMAHYGGMHELFLTTVVTTRIYEENVKRYTKDKEEFMKTTADVSIVIEEARRMLGEGVSNSSIFPTICNEGRKYKMGLFPVTQQGRHISKDLLSQFNTLLLLGMADEDDFKELAKGASQPIKKLYREVLTFEPGQAIITSVDSPFAVPLQIYSYDTYLKMARERVDREKEVYLPPSHSASSFDRFRPSR